MNGKQYATLRNTISFNLKWAKFIRLNPECKDMLEKEYKIKVITNDELEQKVNRILKVTNNQIWDRTFWGIRKEESICAIAVPAEQWLANLPKRYAEFLAD